MVEVAEVEVDVRAVKLWRVVEPLVYIPPRTSRSAPVVVVAFPPRTKAISFPPFGNKAILFVEVANLLLPAPPDTAAQLNFPEAH